jgi:hypothetical protein
MLVLDLILVADVVLTAIAFVGSYYSYSAIRTFRRDIMEKVFGFVAAAFAVIGLVSLVDAVGNLLGADLTSIIDFRIVVIVSYGLVMTGMIVFLRWASQITPQRT